MTQKAYFWERERVFLFSFKLWLMTTLVGHGMYCRGMGGLGQVVQVAKREG